MSLSLRSVIDHLLSDDGRTDLGIKDEWLNIPDLNMKSHHGHQNHHWHHDL